MTMGRMAASLRHLRPLTSAAVSSAVDSSRLVPQPPDLIKWVRREGGFVHPAVKIATSERRNGLGLVASEDIPKGSDIISLPENLPLQFGTVEADSPMFKLVQHVPEELWAMKLGLKLLQERARKGSFWWPYICNLPETYTVPVFFPGEDIKNLQYAPLLYQVNKRCRFLLEFEGLVKQELDIVEQDEHPFDGQHVDSSALGWAMSAVSSRAFRLYGGKRRDGTHAGVPMMLPLIDMCNHNFHPNAEIIQECEAGDGKMLVKVIAAENIKRNDELELNYGCLNNDMFLMDYGFVVPSNPYDCIELKFDSALLDAASMAAGVHSPNFSSPTPWQQELLTHLNLDGENSDLKVRLGGSDVVEGRLIAALRALLSNDEDSVRNLSVDTLKSLWAPPPLRTQNEVAALRTVVALCVIALGHFPTKIMEDELVLKRDGSGTTGLAVRFRMEKKSVIVDVMRSLTRRVKSLLSKESDSTQN